MHITTRGINRSPNKPRALYKMLPLKCSPKTGASLLRRKTRYQSLQFLVLKNPENGFGPVKPSGLQWDRTIGVRIVKVSLEQR